MTQFIRSGHWRTNRYGTTYPVSAHGVNRDDWDRESGDSHLVSQYLISRLRDIHADKSITATFVHPNAQCPVCGARVFFYQNSYGSRVYFDDLGVPWPKHPCTDNSKYQGRRGVLSDRQLIEPKARTVEEILNIQEWIESTDLDPATEFWNQHQQSQWCAYQIARRIKTKKYVLLILTPINDSKNRNVFLCGAKVPSAFKKGRIAFSYRGWITCFDLNQMKPIELELEKLKGSKEFVAALVAG